MMVFLRAVGLVLVFPTLGGRPLPPMLRVGLCAALATLLYGIVPHVTRLSSGLPGLVLAVMAEVILGLAMGFVGRLLFSAVELAGRLIANEIGLMAAPGFDVPQPAQEPLPALLSVFGGVLFFLFGGHIGALTAFVRSFELAAAGGAGFGSGAAETLIRETGHVLELGFRIGAPFVALNFLTSIAFSVLTKAVPKMNVFIMSYPLRTAVGFTLLGGSGALFARYLTGELTTLPLRMLELLPAR